MARLMIVHHTPSSATAELLDAVVRGASDPEITGVEVVRRAALGATATAAGFPGAWMFGWTGRLALSGVRAEPSPDGTVPGS
ncbi:hypothetical protein [Pseudonocardia sp. N23]|uniref:hypothetical protein n=1 Tax=Pseudonocardia sp. N23 TaxID=1987376 RepID=UPI000C0250D3|nr:hypothetical protein TOK_3089 [Pseudonocardia sp. N23]